MFKQITGVNPIAKTTMDQQRRSLRRAWIKPGLVGLMAMGTVLGMIAGAAAVSGDPIQPRLVTPDDGSRPSLETGTIIRRFVEPITRPPSAHAHAGLNTDQEHADSIAPVLTPGTPVYIHHFISRSAAPGDRNFILENGRFFSDFDTPYDPDKTPTLNIRPLDGGRRVPFLIRTFLYPRGSTNEDGTVEIHLKIPVIFQPELEIRSVIVNNRKAIHRIVTSPAGDVFNIEIPIPHKDFEPNGKSLQPIPVFVEGGFVLKSYDTVSPGQFAKTVEIKADDPMTGLARLVVGRDYANDEEKNYLMKVAKEVAGSAGSSYEAIRLINRYLSNELHYFRNNMKRTAVQILQEKLADCDDYTRAMTALCRALGIPCKTSIGAIYDFSNYGAHAWVEVALPHKDGSWHWFICDPTLASASEDRDSFVQFKNRIYLYPLSLDAAALNMPVDQSTDILLNWLSDSEKHNLSPQSYSSTINAFKQSLDRSLMEGVVALKKAGLPIEREFLFAQASSYILLNQLPSEYIPHLRNMKNPDYVIKMDPNNTKTSSRWQIKLDSQDNLILELGVIDEDADLESPEDRLFTSLLHGVYRELKQNLLQGTEERHCLELTFSRDKHSDRLQKVSIRIGRYLLEQHLKKIIEILRKSNLLSLENSNLLESLNQLCSGKNYYYMLELSRTTAFPLDASLATQPEKAP